MKRVAETIIRSVSIDATFVGTARILIALVNICQEKQIHYLKSLRIIIKTAVTLKKVNIEKKLIVNRKEDT